ncbi:tetratricopeptide repeat protein [Devosia sp.]|uniref:O-linked N-acetylglucosamine transferase, SPINDLY family protein n=1 Tax=Devosia sp. TaxID=1871048 RepID=UPI001AC8A795|nr:tetratricopeptide repeat protein [Devosia sp.]MBN9310737.1 tetratricopeptide repeat protein [Devosia sp.]
MSASDSIRPLLEQALALLQKGSAADAYELLAQALAQAPTDFDALNLAGVAATRSGRAEVAVDLLERATAERPDHSGAQNNLGIALRAAGERDRAAGAYRRAISIDPAYAAAHTNLGAVLLDQRRFEEAVACLDEALTYRPRHAETLVLKATALRELRMYEAALEAIDVALTAAPVSVRSLKLRADLLSGLRRRPEAVAAYKRALELAPEDPLIPGLLAYNQLWLCDWSDLAGRSADLLEKARSGQSQLNPFVGLLLFDDPEAHLAVARAWHRRGATDAVPMPTPSASGRLRIGYFSADIRNHAMTHLVSELFARHDRDRYEVTIFAFPAGQTDRYTEQVRGIADRYIDISAMSDSEAVSLARELPIDIAVDLMGHTNGARMGIFARRAAPVQVNYLGYPGTIGSECCDYIIADQTIIPAQSMGHFSEQVVWMPGCYSSRDTRVEVPAGRVARQSQGLPKAAMVYCCFNQAAKILPEQFRDWMSILRQVDGSVLWLLDAGPATCSNLRREAAALGVDPARLVFATKLPQIEHLERLRLADLCLDTLPYNAHTTANDALFVGVPILTLPGRAFAARVCASLVKAVGMPELIVADRSEYIARAVDLGRDRAKLAALRAKLDVSRTTSSLFDVERYTRALEAGYVAIHERYLNGQRPAHIRVDAP